MAQRWIYNAEGGTTSSYPPVLFLPGWGFSGQVLDLAEQRFPWARPIVPLDPATVQSEILDFCGEHNLAAIHLVGWSLGANLAVDYARAFPEKVASLTLLGMRASWPAADIEAIRLGLAAEPLSFLRDFYRKSLLGYKKESRRFVAEQQETLLALLDMQLLGRGLDYLAQWRLPKQGMSYPVSCWHGRRDIIAPVTEQGLIPGAGTTILEHGGHAIFLDPEFIGSE